MRKLKTSRGYSPFIGKLPKGCKLCIEGSKGVLFVTGRCQFPAFCSWYCPLSAERRGERGSYIDEIPLATTPGDGGGGYDDANVLWELEAIDARGISFTGGDPLVDRESLETTLHFLTLVKEKYGPRFHAHLYTNGIGLNSDTVGRLKSAGLDEIRLHPSPSLVKKVKLAKEAGFGAVGVEVPAIPSLEYREYLLELVEKLDAMGADFLNLNEFEVTETNAGDLLARGFEYDRDTLASVKGTDAWIREVLDAIASKRLKISVHYCPTTLKDNVQVRNRYLRRARNVARPHEVVTRDGLLVSGVVRGDESTLGVTREFLLGVIGLPDTQVEVDLAKGELHLPSAVLRDERLLEFLRGKDASASIQETLPLDSREVCESTPMTLARQRGRVSNTDDSKQ
ncbi:MAG: hypothetical protein ACTSU5_15305 [Promethearchaeota archaeon]